jgi:hypothetical protein
MPKEEVYYYIEYEVKETLIREDVKQNEFSVLFDETVKFNIENKYNNDLYLNHRRFHRKNES